MVKVSNEFIVLREFFNNPTYRFHIRELARKTRLNPNTIINIVSKLEKENIIVKEKRKHLVEIFLNFENKSVLNKKRIFNFSRVYDSGILDFLVKNYNPKFISSIGSYSRGEDMENSDIDIVIDTNNKNIVNLLKFEKILKRNIHLILLPKKVTEEFFNNLINGVVLYGAIRK